MPRKGRRRPLKKPKGKEGFCWAWKNGQKARGEKLEKVGKWPEAAEELRCHRATGPGDGSLLPARGDLEGGADAPQLQARRVQQLLHRGLEGGRAVLRRAAGPGGRRRRARPKQLCRDHGEERRRGGIIAAYGKHRDVQSVCVRVPPPARSGPATARKGRRYGLSIRREWEPGGVWRQNWGDGAHTGHDRSRDSVHGGRPDAGNHRSPRPELRGQRSRRASTGRGTVRVGARDTRPTVAQRKARPSRTAQPPGALPPRS